MLLLDGGIPIEADLLASLHQEDITSAVLEQEGREVAGPRLTQTCPAMTPL
jgi:hypothetical protein